MGELATTSLVLALLGLLMAVSVVASGFAGRARVPTAFLFIAIGMLAGSEGVGRIAFENYELAFRLGTATLVLILFDGGLGASWPDVRRVVAPASLLATVGVVVTAAIVAGAAHLLGLSWSAAWLLGAIVASTDAAAVFSVLRASCIDLSKRVGATVELESGLNDPVAVILTLALTAAQSGQHPSAWIAMLRIVGQLAIGVGAGLALGFSGRWLLRRTRPAAAGLLPVLTVAIAFVSFGGTTLARGSGFLATYVAGLVIGNGPLPYRSGLLRVHDAVAWLGQVVMFLVLGLLSFPSRLLGAAPLGFVLAVVLAVIARPVAVALCLWPFRYRPREIAFVGWLGLRGAVPIILAIVPILAAAPQASAIFDIVFFIVIVNTLVQGASVRGVARLLGVARRPPPPPAAAVEIASTLPLRSQVLSFYVQAPSAVAGARVADVPLPRDAAVMLIVRGQELVAARGETVLSLGDHVFVFCRPEDRREVELLFGREE